MALDAVKQGEVLTGNSNIPAAKPTAEMVKTLAALNAPIVFSAPKKEEDDPAKLALKKLDDIISGKASVVDNPDAVMNSQVNPQGKQALEANKIAMNTASLFIANTVASDSKTIVNALFVFNSNGKLNSANGKPTSLYNMTEKEIQEYPPSSLDYA